jgi:ABC-type antimicrobial peptide transport system permease subunit
LIATFRTTGDPYALVPSIRTSLRGIDPELAIAEIHSMSDLAGVALAERNFALWLFQLFAILTLGMAAFGVYGVLAYFVQQRRKEMGIRMALGATQWEIAKLVLRGCTLLALVGIGAGLVLAPVAGKALSSLLYGVKPTDWITLALAPLVVAVISFSASFLPAWTAARGKVLNALREE